MPKRLPRRVISYPIQNDEEYAQDQQYKPQKKTATAMRMNEQTNTDTSDNNQILADMAQVFLQAQAKLDQNTDGNNQEIIGLLEKVSRQLEDIQPNSGVNSQQSKNNKQNQFANNSTLPEQDTPSKSSNQVDKISQELQSLFKKVSQQGSNAANNDTANNDAAIYAQEIQGTSQQKNKNTSITAQTAAQVLAQAQYELANELEVSLKKLKQVISESEKVANKISNLLGEKNNTQK